MHNKHQWRLIDTYHLKSNNCFAEGVSPVDFDFDKHIAQAVINTGKITNRFTHQLFAYDKRERPEAYASCIFFEIDDCYYLTTAAHAYREIKNTGSDILLVFLDQQYFL